MDGEGQHVKLQIEAVFGKDHGSLYALLDTTASATSAEIKRAYRRQALKHHPDRGGDAETFKALSAIHSILTDEEKRKVYDETGEVDGGGDELMSEESFEFWDKYFRSLFPKVTVADIESFGRQYKGSTGQVSSDYNERQDILDAYTQREGRFAHIMECVMLAEEEDEERITDIISAAIAAGEVAATPAFEKHLVAFAAKKEKNQKKKRDAFCSSSSSSSSSASDNNTTNTSAKGQKKSTASSSSKKKKKSGDAGSMDDLAALILGNRSSKQGAMSSIFAKYGGEEEGPEGLSEADFLRTRATLGAENTNTSGASKKKKKARDTKKIK